jgi:CcmD family protein
MSVILEAGVAIYVALGVALAVWVGIFVYLWRLDAQAQELRRKLDRQPDTATPPAPTATLRTQRSSDEPAAGNTEWPGEQQPGT